MKKLLEQRILPSVTKPGRYLGHEWNSVHKNWDQTAVKMVFAFPDVYEVGMSHLGTRILYDIVNRRDDVLMERVFAPWVDMEAKLKEFGLPIFSLESQRPLKDFDIIGFTLQYEMSFSNILTMLDMAKVPFLARERGEADPLIIAGGPSAYNPEPVADFFDLIVIGEGEEVIHELLDSFKSWQGSGRNKEDLLQELAGIPGIYVPSFYNVTYNNAGSISSIKPNRTGVPVKVTKRIVKNFDEVDFPLNPIVPYTEIVHDRIMLEVLRGCTRGCRFCQAGMVYRPVREKKPETLLRQARELVKKTGYNEISLTSLSTSDYSCIGEVLPALISNHGQQGIGVSLPSLRVDSFSVDLAKEVQKIRKTGLTFAPEAGTQRMRDVINKGVTEENLINAVSAAFEAGWSSIKLYFMIGLPTETEEDLEGIVDLAYKVLRIGMAKAPQANRHRIKITVSASSFVPKAHTPFQWGGQTPLQELKEKQNYLKSRLKDRRINFNWHDAQLSLVEAVFARGDRRLSKALIKGWELGCKFDGWTEHFKFGKWLQAFEEVGIDPHFYANRPFGFEEILPWEHLSVGVTKEYMLGEYQKALAVQTTSDCRYDQCPQCGLCSDLATKPLLNRVSQQGGEADVPL